MAPIEYIPIMREYYQRGGLGEYPLYEPRDDSWAPLAKPLRECRLALICSAGLSRRDQQPFRRHGHDDFSIREIATETPAEQLVINYDFFDHRDADQDPNCLFPLVPLADLAAEGFIGALCPTAYALGIGRWRDPATPERLQTEVAAALHQRCRAEGADAALLVPG